MVYICSYSVVVITLDFESSNPSSNLGKSCKHTSCFVSQQSMFMFLLRTRSWVRTLYEANPRIAQLEEHLTVVVHTTKYQGVIGSNPISRIFLTYTLYYTFTYLYITILLEYDPYSTIHKTKCVHIQSIVS